MVQLRWEGTMGKTERLGMQIMIDTSQGRLVLVAGYKKLPGL